MSWTDKDRDAFRIVARKEERTASKSERKRLRMVAWAFALAALIAAGFAAYLSGEMARLREQVRRWEAVAHAEAANASVAVESLGDMEIDRRDAIRRESRTRGELQEQASRFGADLRRLESIDRLVEQAGFESVTEALAHARVHHGQILTCSSALVEARSWFQWCEGGFWRPESAEVDP